MPKKATRAPARTKPGLDRRSRAALIEARGRATKPHREFLELLGAALAASDYQGAGGGLQRAALDKQVAAAIEAATEPSRLTELVARGAYPSLEEAAREEARKAHSRVSTSVGERQPWKLLSTAAAAREVIERTEQPIDDVRRAYLSLVNAGFLSSADFAAELKKAIIPAFNKAFAHWKLCIDCGAPFAVRPRAPKSLYCSKKCGDRAASRGRPKAAGGKSQAENAAAKATAAVRHHFAKCAICKKGDPCVKKEALLARDKVFDSALTDFDESRGHPESAAEAFDESHGRIRFAARKSAAIENTGVEAAEGVRRRRRAL